MPYTGHMSELILHHYEVSPYAEKARLMMGLKQLRWHSVQIPMVMPKPDLTALTGGFRLTPVLQVGADIYCDTKTIARRLEREQPSPTLYPSGESAVQRAVAFWGETVFMDLVAIGLALGIFPPDFIEDRSKMVPGGFDAAAARIVAPSKVDEVRAKLDLLDRELANGQPFLLGPAVGLADLSAYHPLWALRSVPNGAGLLAALTHVPAWMERVAAIGHGARVEMDAAAAIDIARRAQPTTQPHVDAADPTGRRVGDRVQVFPEPYGRDPVAGELVYADVHEIAIRRTDPRVGEVVVHFPREGYVTVSA